MPPTRVRMAPVRKHVEAVIKRGVAEEIDGVSGSCADILVRLELPPLGKRLAALRKERGLTPERFADLLGVSRKMVDYHERRARNPSMEVVAKIATALRVPAGIVLGEHAAVGRRSKAGPPSALKERIARVRELPRKEQEFAIRMLDTVLEGARR